MDKIHLKFQSRMVSFLLFPHGIFSIFGDGETHPFFGYGIFPCSALESLALLGFVTRGPLCIGYRRSLNNAKDLGLQFCQVVACLVVWWVAWLSGWLVGGWVGFSPNHLENMQMVVKLDHLTSIDK